METEPHLEAQTPHVSGRLAISGVSAAIKVKVLKDSRSDSTAMSEELVQALQGQLGMTQTALTQAFVGNVSVVTSLSQECDVETQSCLLHLSIETPWGPVRFAMPLIVLPREGDVNIMAQKTLREKLSIIVMTQLKAYVLNVHGYQNGAGMWASPTLMLCCRR